MYYYIFPFNSSLRKNQKTLQSDSKLESEWIDYKFTPEDYVANYDKVVAYGTYMGTYKITGKSFTARVTHVWKLKNSKIVSFEQFVDSQPVNNAMK